MIAISQWFFTKKIEKSPKKVPKSRVFPDKMQKTATHMDNSVEKAVFSSKFNKNELFWLITPYFCVVFAIILQQKQGQKLAIWSSKNAVFKFFAPRS